jgi:hypothetical protein
MTDITMTSGVKMNCILYVYKDWTESGRPDWKLIYARPGDDSFCGAYGECSRPYFRTMREAIANGERMFKETATKWNGLGWDFPAPRKDKA